MDALAPTPASSGSAGGVPQGAAAPDADDTPPNSRLFFVVPRSADPAALSAALASFPGFQRSDTAHVSTKGVAFAKFARASHALAALEAVSDAGGVLDGHRVKCMVAAPRGGNGPAGSGGLAPSLSGGGVSAAPPRPPAAPSLAPGGPLAAGAAATSTGSAGRPRGGTQPPAPGLGPLTAGFGGLGWQQQGASQPLPPPTLAPPAPARSGGSTGGPPPPPPRPAASTGSAGGSRGSRGGGGPAGCRLYAVVPRSATPDALAAVFAGAADTPSSFAGLALKRDRATGVARGFCYAHYTSPEAAAAAVARLDGAELPGGGGFRLKVVVAEPRGRGRGGGAAQQEAAPAAAAPPASGPAPTPPLLPATQASEGGGAGGLPTAPPGSPSLHSDEDEPSDSAAGPVAPGPGRTSPDTETEDDKDEATAAGARSPPRRPRPATSDESSRREVVAAAAAAAAAARRRRGSPDTDAVAAVREGLAHMSMPDDGGKGGGGGPAAEAAVARVAARAAAPRPPPPPGGEADDGAPPSSPSPSCVLFTVLTRPLPSWALEHVLAAHGPLVGSVSLRPGDPRFGVATFSSPSAAHAAAAALDGTTILGAALGAYTEDPLGESEGVGGGGGGSGAVAPFSKRPRI